jgi:lysophospholipid acyltransferase (LPLAT)-like uncharacterized protein
MALHTLKTAIFGGVGYGVLRFLCGTNRLSITGTDVIDRYVGQGRNILTFWHSRLFYLVYYYALRVRTPKASILISLSRDGDYGQALVDWLKQDAVRGSSSRGGTKAVLALAARLDQGNNIALTPDGPRGPAFQVQDGVIRLAQVTGASIIPASYDASRKWTLKSWDRFILPKPFGRIHLALGEPIYVPKEMSPDERILYGKKVQDALLQLDGLCADQVR